MFRRRQFLLSLVGGFLLPILLPFLDRFKLGAMARRFLRPPGALPGDKFLDLCIGCGQCANVCPNQCIELNGLENGLENLATPRIIPRARGCILCMACTQVCPTGALEKMEPTEEGKLAVTMGMAILNEDLCYSYHGRTCGACYRACPLPGKAMTIGLYEQPTVHEDQCVGCGLCEQACIHMPQAIRVIPFQEWNQLKEKRA